MGTSKFIKVILYNFSVWRRSSIRTSGAGIGSLYFAYPNIYTILAFEKGFSWDNINKFNSWLNYSSCTENCWTACITHWCRTWLTVLLLTACMVKSHFWGVVEHDSEIQTIVIALW